MNNLIALKLLSKEDLLQCLGQSGFSDVVKIIKDKELDGETFINLKEIETVRWRLSQDQNERLWKCITEIKTNPSLLNICNNRRIERSASISTSTSRAFKAILSDVLTTRGTGEKNMYSLPRQPKKKTVMPPKPPTSFQPHQPHKDAIKKKSIPLPPLRNKIPPSDGYMKMYPLAPKYANTYKDEDDDGYLTPSEHSPENTYETIPNHSRGKNNRYSKDTASTRIQYENSHKNSLNATISIGLNNINLKSGEANSPTKSPKHNDINYCKYFGNNQKHYEPQKHVTIKRTTSHATPNAKPFRNPLPAPRDIYELPSNPLGYLELIPPGELYKNSQVIKYKETHTGEKFIPANEECQTYANSPRFVDCSSSSSDEWFLDCDDDSDFSHTEDIAHSHKPLPNIPNKTDSPMGNLAPAFPSSNCELQQSPFRLLKRQAYEYYHSTSDRSSREETKFPQADREIDENIGITIDVTDEPFYRNITRKEAKELLQGLEDGTFLIRPSTTFFLSLSIKSKKVHNFGIEKVGNKIQLNAESCSDSPTFRTLKELIEYFTREPITFREKKNNNVQEIILKPLLKRDPTRNAAKSMPRKSSN